MFVFASPPVEFDRHDTARQRELIATTFADDGWEVPRLLGDMRSYNFVVAVTPDIEGSQFRLRAIDFDQQSYEGRKNFYLPQYFRENNPIIFLGIEHMEPETVKQYQLEERSLIAAATAAESMPPLIPRTTPGKPDLST